MMYDALRVRFGQRGDHASRFATAVANLPVIEGLGVGRRLEGGVLVVNCYARAKYPILGGFGPDAENPAVLLHYPGVVEGLESMDYRASWGPSNAARA